MFYFEVGISKERVISWNTILWIVGTASCSVLCQLSSLKTVSKHGAGERSTRAQTGCLLKEQYPASPQVLCRKSFKLGTSEQQPLHLTTSCSTRVLKKGHLKMSLKNPNKPHTPRNDIFFLSLCFYSCSTLSFLVNGRKAISLGILKTAEEKYT